MKHGSNPRRGRSRGNGKRNPSQRSGSFESSGPEAKIRGTAQQVQDKYLAMARDAFSAGDRIAAEGYFQHAEHYYRVLHPVPEDRGKAGQGRVHDHPAANPKPPVPEGGGEATKKTAAKSPADEPQPAESDPEPASA